MRRSEVKVGTCYLAKVGSKLVAVKVAKVQGGAFEVKNLATNQVTTFRTASKFVREMTVKEAALRDDKLVKMLVKEGKKKADPTESASTKKGAGASSVKPRGMEAMAEEAGSEQPELDFEPVEDDNGSDPTVRSAQPSTAKAKPSGTTQKKSAPGSVGKPTMGSGTPTTEQPELKFEPVEDKENPDPLNTTSVEGGTQSTADASAVTEQPNITSVSAALRRASGATDTTVTPPNVVVEALAGTGKTTSLIMGVAWAFGQKLWKKILHTMAERINEKATRLAEKSGEPTKLVDPNRFEFIPSHEQQAIWDAMALSRGQAKSIVYAAFNKGIVVEFSEQWGWLVNLLQTVGINLQFATINSLGYRAVTNAFGRLNCVSWHMENLLAAYLGKDLKFIKRTPADLQILNATCQLAALSKLTLVGWEEGEGFNPANVSHEELDRITAHYGLEVNGDRERVYDLVKKVLELSLSPKDTLEIDFDDQNWLPIVLSLPLSKVDLVLVDECVPGWTPIMLADGRSLTIQEIVDSPDEFRVRAHDTKTGIPMNCRVIGKHRILNQKPLVKVKVGRGRYCRQHCNFVVCTTDHKLWTVNRGWVEAGQLTIRDWVIVETAAKTTTKGKITRVGKHNLARLQQGNQRWQYVKTKASKEQFNKIKGGNGRGPTLAEETLLTALGEGWVYNHPVSTNMARGSGYPSCYKIDVANPELMVGFEVDGNTHGSPEANERDKKKQTLLENLGWTIYRVTNKQAIQKTNEVVCRVTGNCPTTARVLSVDPTEIRDNYVYDITVENCHDFYANGILVHNCQDTSRAKQEFIRKLGKRIIAVGDPNQCQPPGTLVYQCKQGNRWQDGKTISVPIEQLKAGDSVASWDRKSSSLVAVARVNEVKCREYTGPMLTIQAGGKTTRCTPNHKWVTRWTSTATSLWCVYMMQRTRESRIGPVHDYRIGWCQLFMKSGDFHLAQRARLESADAAWIVSLHDNKSSASLSESFTALRFQIPLVPFNHDKTATLYTEEWLLKFWNRVHGCVDMEECADNLLEVVGRSKEFPLYRKDKQQKQGDGSAFETEGYNLIQGLMALPVAPEKLGGDNSVEWYPIEELVSEDYSGPVYSLDVNKHHKYIADGLVTCNSLYGFAGADTESMSRLKVLLGNGTPLEPLPLTETRRCGKAIVAEAQKLVPSFRAHESNPEGSVRYQRLDKYMDEVDDKDMVLCRINAPLVSQAIKFIKAGRKAVIRGRDFGGQLIAFVKKFKANTVPELITAVGEWLQSEVVKENAKRNPSEARIIALQDRYSCVCAFTEGTSTVEDVVAKIELVFAGKHCTRCRKHFKEEMEQCSSCRIPLVKPEGVLFSSIHRAKGLEADKVFILQVRGAAMPLPAKGSWQQHQERCALYVGQTRPRLQLTYVS